MLKIKDPLQFFIAFILTIIAIISVANYLQNAQTYSLVANNSSLFLAQLAGARPRPTNPTISRVCQATDASFLDVNTVVSNITRITNQCIRDARTACVAPSRFTATECTLSPSSVAGALLNPLIFRVSITRTCPYTCGPVASS